MTRLELRPPPPNVAPSIPSTAPDPCRPMPALLLCLPLLVAGCYPSLDANAPSGFELHPDFAMELVASEPLIFDPVDLEFDEEGRAFVVEMPGYPFPEEAGRVVLLSDSDGDGTWDERKIWAEDLGIADSVLPHRGGLLVASPPDMVFLEDRDDDGRAETRTVLLSGFAVENPQHNFNGLSYGLDNWIYGANGGNGGELYWPDEPEERLPLRFDDFRVDLGRRRLQRTGRSSGGFEMTFDSWGRSFSTHNLFHVSHLVLPARYLEDLPPAWQSSRHRLSSHTSSPISDHGDDGPARIYPIGVQETRVNHPEQSGHFSGACGITAYVGGAFPPELADNVFVADVVLNLVHRSVVRPDGASFTASRGRPGVEFLASSDRDFRPVNMTVGPDGALYLLDMHRRVIEHPEWIPDEIERDLDLDAGKDRGRIYRITPRHGLPKAAARLGRDDTDSLVAALGHRNGWWRLQAQRLLVEEHATRTIPSLRRVLREEADPHWRLHALWTLDGLDAGAGKADAVDEELLLSLFGDSHPRLRESAVKIAERRLEGSVSLRQAVLDLARDDDARVRLQVALSLSTLEPERSVDPIVVGALLDVVADDPADRWLRLAVLAGLGGRTREALAQMLEGRPLIETPGGVELFGRVCRLAASHEIPALLSLLAQAEEIEAAALASALDGLAGALESDDAPDDDAPENAPGRPGITASSRSWLADLGSRSGPQTLPAWRLERALGIAPPPAQRTPLLAQARERALDPTLDVGARSEALDLYSFAEEPARRAVLLELLAPRHPAPLQSRALRQLTAMEPAAVASDLLARWRQLAPSLRREASLFLLRHAQSHRPLLDAIEAGRVTLGELNLDLERRRALLFADDPQVRQRAESLFSDSGVVTRGEALTAMRRALALEGRAGAGARLYEELCSRCHRYGGRGTAAGPDLTEIARKSPETLLHDILDPNAAVETEFLSYNVRTKEGRLLSGLLRDEAETGLVLLQAGGIRDEVPRNQIDELWTDGLSLMPEGLEEGLEPQDMADLLAFLQRGTTD